MLKESSKSEYFFETYYGPQKEVISLAVSKLISKIEAILQARLVLQRKSEEKKSGSEKSVKFSSQVSVIIMLVGAKDILSN